MQDLEYTLKQQRVNPYVNFSDKVESSYKEIVSVLNTGAELYVPVCRKNFYKFWWDEDLSSLKQASVESNRLWKAAGKPRHGSIFDKRQRCRAQYRKRIREGQQLSTSVYTNELHEALLAKDGPNFWKCWRSKFQGPNRCHEIDGCVDHNIIVNNFAQYFSKIYTANNSQRASLLHEEYLRMRENYFGFPLPSDWEFETELVSKIIADLKCGRAAGIDGLTAEHLVRAHPVLPVVLSKLFRLILLCRQIPVGFGYSYIVPIPKTIDCRTKSMTCEDFRGIAISPILSKVFEYCFIHKFGEFLSTDCNQFGFKKGVGCASAIYTARNVIERFVKGGCTVNICAIDLSKAFDKVNHHALFIKLMKRNIPVALLELLECWLSCCISTVKWNGLFSRLFAVEFGVRQGSVLSPLLFAVYLSDISVKRQIIPCCFVLLYADDILLIAPSVSELQQLFSNCERELIYLDMKINVKKSSCMRIGPRCDVRAVSISTNDGYSLPWVNEIRYLGIFIIQSCQFRCTFACAKQSFYRALNAILGKVGRLADEIVVLELVKSKCIPILLHGLECCPLNKSEIGSLDFTVIRFLMKLFKTSNKDIITECCQYFNFLLPSELITNRTERFIDKFNKCHSLRWYFNITL